MAAHLSATSHVLAIRQARLLPGNAFAHKVDSFSSRLFRLSLFFCVHHRIWGQITTFDTPFGIVSKWPGDAMRRAVPRRTSKRSWMRPYVVLVSDWDHEQSLTSS